MKINHVKQRRDDDCVLTCVEMVTGITVPEMELKYDFDYPTNIDSMIKIMCLNGFICVRQVDDIIYNERVYFLTVPSLNIAGQLHFIILDTRNGFKLYDPNSGKDGKKFYDHSYRDTLSWSNPIEIVDSRCVKKEVQ